MKARMVLVALGLAAVMVLVAQLKAVGESGDTVASSSAPGDGVAGGCGSGIGPDVILADLVSISKWGSVGEISAYSFGTTACNFGSEPALWVAANSNHPVIAQNLYRYNGGRFEQLGMSWLKHGFSAATGTLCCVCQNPGDSQKLGVGCSDPYGSTLNGDQDGQVGGCGGACGGLGPRYEVNPTTGVFPFPYDTAGVSGDAIYKRLQVRLNDIDPALNAGAKYYGEGHYVTADDAAAGNHHNNASFEQILVSIFQGDAWILLFTGDITRELPAIYAWQNNDPDVVIEVVEDDGDPDDNRDGRFYLGYRVTDNGDGTWHYEYALYNMNSRRAAKAFLVPVPSDVTVSNIEFHDVDHHSGDGVGGENFEGEDWAVGFDAGQIIWSTQGFGENQNANALRWGTLYNFRFDADTPPVETDVTITPFRVGLPLVLTAPALAPSSQASQQCPWDLNGDGSVGIVDFLDLLSQWGTNPGGPPDFDGDQNVGIVDMLELFSRWGDCPGLIVCGDPDAGNCFDANGTPGCAQQECCEVVCATTPQCCEVAWDTACRDLASTLCGNCGDPGAGDCCLANGTPGCDDEACCNAICLVDPICCAAAWDVLCANAAVTLCGCP